MTYLEKLKSPLWQKKRLLIMDRDNFTCQHCGATDKTLHVHHKYYNNSDPWDYPDSALITLCYDCHEAETINLESNDLIQTIRQAGAMAADIAILTEAFIFADLKEISITNLCYLIAEVVKNSKLQCKVLK